MLYLSLGIVCFVITGGLTQTDPSLIPLIIGGEKADIGEWPHQCIMFYRDSFICGAIVRNSTHCLSAAHCTEGTSAGDLLIICGVTDLTTILTNPNRQDSIVLSIEYYTQPRDDFADDIVVLTLASPLDLSGPYVQSVPLATTADGFDETSECWITGFGRMVNGGGPFPDHLQEAQVRLVGIPECRAMWHYSITIDDNIICIIGITLKESSCSGDSGGPLVCLAADGASWKLVGITNWGMSGCPPEYPAGYCDVRLEKYQQWLVDGKPPPPPPSSRGWWFWGSWGRRRRRR